jgi:hypothetical protein
MASALICSSSLGDVVSNFGPMLALVGVAVTLWTYGARDERRRRRELHARALEAVAQYYEMPFLIRRRRHDEPSAERARLAARFADVQAELASCEALIRADSDAGVRDAYAAVVRDVREHAGNQASLAWEAPPITSDSQMGMGDLTEALKPIRATRSTCESAMARSTTAWHRRRNQWRQGRARLDVRRTAGAR